MLPIAFQWSASVGSEESEEELEPLGKEPSKPGCCIYKGISISIKPDIIPSIISADVLETSLERLIVPVT